MVFATFSQLLTLVPLAAHAAVLSSQGFGEHVLLCNCVRQGTKSSVMGYYSGSPSGSPAATAVTVNGQTSTWEGRSVSGTFSDGNVFTSDLGSGYFSDGTYAGPGRNKYAGFYCYKHWQENIFSLSDGTVCSSVYDCSHSEPNRPIPVVPPAGKLVEIDFEISGDFVEVTSTGKDVYSILSTVRLDGNKVDTTTIDVGGSCAIQFSGHSADSGRTLEAMRALLLSLTSDANVKDKMGVRWDTDEYNLCEAYCGDSCCRWYKETKSHLKIPRTVAINAWNIQTNSERGALVYTIGCSPPQRDCTAAAILKGVLGVLAPIPELGAAFGMANGLVSIGASISGC